MNRFGIDSVKISDVINRSLGPNKIEIIRSSGVPKDKTAFLQVTKYDADFPVVIQIFKIEPIEKTTLGSLVFHA